MVNMCVIRHMNVNVRAHGQTCSEVIGLVCRITSGNIREQEEWREKEEREGSSNLTCVWVCFLQAEMRAAVFLALEEQDKLEVRVHVQVSTSEVKGQRSRRDDIRCCGFFGAVQEAAELDLSPSAH